MKETLHVIREGKSDPRLHFAPEEEASSALSVALSSCSSSTLPLSFSRFPPLAAASSRVPFEHSGGSSCLSPLPPPFPRHLTIYPCLSLSLPLFPYLPARQ